MPMDRSLYPDNWEEITERLKQEVGQQCENCGVKNGARIIRRKDFPEIWLGAESWNPDDLGWIYHPPITVVLTTAHLDHNPANNARTNLKVLCQRCHLVYDTPHHVENARSTRIKKKKEIQADAGQLGLFEGNSE